MSKAGLVTLVLLSAGCNNEKGVRTYNDEPVASIFEPIDGTVFAEGEVVYFSGVVDDDQDPEELLVEWTSSIDGVLPDDDGAGPDGYVEFASGSLSEGVHVITLRVTDDNASQGEDSVEIEITDVPDLPSIRIDHPGQDEIGLEDYAFIFQATVSDVQDPPEDLEVEVVASPGGLICDMAVDGSGNATCAAILAIGKYILTFTVFDTDGNAAEAVATYEVVSPLDYDADGDGYTPNGGDCNDSNNTVYPGAPEICDGLDNDCNDLTAIDVGTECYDDDGDGYCESPPCVNTSETLEDCDDTKAEVNPMAEEIEYNGVDDDCDPSTQDDDFDGDGYGHLDDCDDEDPDLNPGEPEICADGIDNNCNGLTNELDAYGCNDFYLDNDGDTFGVAGATECWCEAGSYPYTGLDATDCYDSNAAANPAQTGWFTGDRGDGSFDYDCSGSTERQYMGVSGGCAWDVILIECDVNGGGWETTEPTCGGNGNWIDDCDAVYDPLCYAMCLFSPDPIGCLLKTCSADCDPEYTPLTQGCR